MLAVFPIQVHLHGAMIHRGLFFPTGLGPIIPKWLQNVARMKAGIQLAFLTRQNMMAPVLYLQLIIPEQEQGKQAGHRLWATVIMKIFPDGAMALHPVAALQTRIIYQSLHRKMDLLTGQMITAMIQM